ncbi:uncharacterized protein LOC141619963 [Silene latifolia]|uniref:uncharacterized protein LOC141619963 n=1 Tax=Silene latifolia TaxID=37657 RepID=UPI003D786846
MELLSRYLKTLCSKPNVSHHPKCAKLGLTHLIFADDLMIFTRGDVPSVTVVLHTLKDFSSWSGLSANIYKTDIYFGGVSSVVKAQILNVTGFSEGTFPFRHLGLPLDNARIHTDTYGLLTSVIFGITNFWCANALLPKNIIKTINKLCKKNFWQNDGESNRLSFHGWRKVCSPWENGGFGIKEILSWNKVVLAKKLWTLDTQQSGLWFSWNKAYNFPNTNIWEVQSKHYHSESFRSIIVVKNKMILRTGTPTAAISLYQSWIHGGKFCLANAYTWFKGPSIPHPWAPTLKHTYIIPSHRIITSLAMQGHLTTMDNLTTRGLFIINRCVLYKAANESYSHLFFSCSFSKTLWERILHWLGLPHHSTDFKNELVWSLHRKHIRHWKNGWFRSCLAAACYHLWSERNIRLFQGIERPVDKLLRTIKFQISVQVLHNTSCAQYDRAVQGLNST